MLAFMMATGGPEQDKLLKQIYLSKVLQNRCDLLNNKAHLISESLYLALLTDNKRLFACTRELLIHMTNQNQADEILGLPEPPSDGTPVQAKRVVSRIQNPEIDAVIPTPCSTDEQLHPK